MSATAQQPSVCIEVPPDGVHLSDGDDRAKDAPKSSRLVTIAPLGVEEVALSVGPASGTAADAAGTAANAAIEAADTAANADAAAGADAAARAAAAAWRPLPSVRASDASVESSEPIEEGWYMGNAPPPRLQVEGWTSTSAKGFEAVVFLHGFNTPIWDALKICLLYTSPSPRDS